jgi:hypothetical protein
VRAPDPTFPSFHIEYPFSSWLVAVLPILRFSYLLCVLYFRQLVKKYIYWAEGDQLIAELANREKECLFPLASAFVAYNTRIAKI